MLILLSLKSFIDIIFLRKINKSHLVIYSENINYYKFFEKTIYLLKSNYKINYFYLTSDINEYEKLKQELRIYYIGSGLIRALIFLFIQCKVFLLTLADLHNFELKRSNSCSKYVYLFHSLQSSHVQYNYNAFQYYDVIFCNGQYQKKEIEKSEVLFNFKEKRKIITGNTYYEFLKKNSKQETYSNKILIAPSWNLNKNNFLSDHCLDLLKFLISKNYDCIFRPHPMHFKKNKKHLNLIYKLFKNNKKFYFDRASDNLGSLKNSKLLITDYSGIATEYILAFSKPVIYLDTQPKIHNKFHKDFKLKALEQMVRENFGFTASVKNFNEIENIILDYTLVKKDKILEFANIHLSYINHSNEVVAKELNNLLNEK